MSWKRTLADALSAAHDQSIARQEAEERDRNARFAQDKGLTWQATLANVHDRMHPKAVPLADSARGEASGIDPAGSSAAEVLVGAAGADALAHADSSSLLEPYEYRLPLEYYGTLGALEAVGKGYGAVNYDEEANDWRKHAWGMYGITGNNLHDLGFLDANGQWTGQYGINSKQDFWSNKNQAQERALDEFMRRMEGLNGRVGNFAYEGRVNQRRILSEKDALGNAIHPPLTITRSGLQAAAHRAGQQWVREYLRWLERNGWETAGKDFPATVPFTDAGTLWTPEKIRDWLLRVETRLRQFEKVPYAGPGSGVR